MRRKYIYEIIDGERSYQEQVWGANGSKRTSQTNNSDPSKHDIGSWIVFMDYYLDLAKKEISTTDKETQVLDILRKVVALGIACFEQHGVPERKC